MSQTESLSITRKILADHYLKASQTNNSILLDIEVYPSTCYYENTIANVTMSTHIPNAN